MRALIGILGLVVLALAGSWAWVRFGSQLQGAVGALREVWPASGTAREAAGPSPDRVIRVQVLNGTREGGVGTRVASYLREGGFMVTEVRNADRNDYFATLVVARREEPSAARAVARYLGRPPVILEARSGGTEDVTLIIGSDRSRVRIEP